MFEERLNHDNCTCFIGNPFLRAEIGEEGECIGRLTGETTGGLGAVAALGAFGVMTVAWKIVKLFRARTAQSVESRGLLPIGILLLWLVTAVGMLAVGLLPIANQPFDCSQISGKGSALLSCSQLVFQGGNLALGLYVYWAVTYFESLSQWQAGIWTRIMSVCHLVALVGMVLLAVSCLTVLWVRSTESINIFFIIFTGTQQLWTWFVCLRLLFALWVFWKAFYDHPVNHQSTFAVAMRVIVMLQITLIFENLAASVASIIILVASFEIEEPLTHDAAMISALSLLWASSFIISLLVNLSTLADEETNEASPVLFFPLSSWCLPCLLCSPSLVQSDYFESIPTIDENRPLSNPTISLTTQAEW